jgi:DMSO/TMAO reductase YedYZ molybdopterin-dependent catalytic subunit
MKNKKWLFALVLVVSILAAACSGAGTKTVTPAPSAAATGAAPGSPSISGAAEIEATEYLGRSLTPIKDQRNNALKGVQKIDRDSYKLTVDGLVDKPLSLSYADLLAYSQISRLTELDCVEGWNFVAKWSGPELKAIFNDAGVKPEALIAIFYSTDAPEGYSSLALDYIREKDIIIALKLNDLTLPPDRGFPFQVVADSKFGYKWAKWIVRIELSSNTSFRGYWESGGYSNKADVGGPSFGD